MEGFFSGLMPLSETCSFRPPQKTVLPVFALILGLGANLRLTRPSGCSKSAGVFCQGLIRTAILPNTQRILELSVCVGRHRRRRIELFRGSREIGACFVRIAGDDQAVLLLFKAANSLKRVYNIGNCTSGDYHMTSLTSDRLSLTARFR